MLEKICLKVKIDGDSRYQKVGDRKGSENKPICGNCANLLFMYCRCTSFQNLSLSEQWLATWSLRMDTNVFASLPNAFGRNVRSKLCGKYVSRMQHVRLKITSRRCKNEGGMLLASAGLHHNDNHLDFSKRKLNLKYNSGKHLLKWNRKTGDNDWCR